MNLAGVENAMHRVSTIHVQIKSGWLGDSYTSSEN